jgi:hypothetical protein
MTTTGFGDIHLRNAPPPLQLYGVALMLSGTAALPTLYNTPTSTPVRWQCWRCERCAWAAMSATATTT